MEAILDSYQNYNYENANFLAERFKCILDSELTKCIYGEVLFSQGKYWMAREVLKDCPSDRGRYLYAFSCFKTNDFAEAETALTLDGNRNPIKRLDDVVNGSHGIYLLGLIREMSEKREQAAQCFLKAFERNPLIFSALEKFLSLSDNPQI